MIPKLRKKNWNKVTKNGKIKEKPFDILKPIPQTKLSQDIANPRQIASLKSIVFELSKSEIEGLFIISVKLKLERKL